MILSNVAIFEALDDGRLVISPEPRPRTQTTGGPKPPYATTTVDLRLGQHLQIPKDGVQTVIDLREPGRVATTLSALCDMKTLDRDWYRLARNQFVLAQTVEEVRLVLPHYLTEPGCARPALAARVEGKSSLARFGLLVNFTAPTIHAGWSGKITLEIMCLGTPLMLYPEMPICQLTLEEVSGTPAESESQFQHQSTPSGEQTNPR